MEFEYPRMAHVSGPGPGSLDDRLVLRPIGIDDFSSVRYLHATSLRAQTLEVLTEEEVAAFVRLVYSPAYPDFLMKEEVFGSWLDGELKSSASTAVQLPVVMLDALRLYSKSSLSARPVAPRRHCSPMYEIVSAVIVAPVLFT